MRILRYRGNSYASPEPINAAPRPGARSYRWVKYAIETNKVVSLRQRETAANNDQLVAWSRQECCGITPLMRGRP